MITLTTDFGTRDGYVAAMKGTMLDIHPQARLVDVTHEIHPQDVMEAAFVLRTAVPYFPTESVHLVVVDPGVGTQRRAVAVRHETEHGVHTFVGPDNGIFPLVLETESPDEAVVLDAPDAWRTPEPSATFHGRDVFAPVAAHLAAGRDLPDVGSPIDTLKPLRWALPIVDAQTVEGMVIHVDRFGNCITNVRRDTLHRAQALDADASHEAGASDNDASHGEDADAPDSLLRSSPDDDSTAPADGVPPVKAYAGSAILENVRATYGDVAEGEPLLLFGSTGFLEIAVNAGNAAELLDVRKGDSVKLVLQNAL